MDNARFRALCRMCRAAAAVAAALGLPACADLPTPPTGEGGGGGELSVRPTMARVTALGDTVRFRAGRPGRGGFDDRGAEATWRSSDTAVATVDDDGLATARGEGQAAIEAEMGGESATAVLLVRQEVASVVVAPDTALLADPGDTVRFSAGAADANGNPVPDVELAWSGSDTLVAEVDADGVATARGAGLVEVRAMAPGARADTASLRVFPGPPTVTGVAPAPLREGGTAVVSGRNFSPSPSQNRVILGEDTAVVEAASPARLSAVVGSEGCRPARELEVRVEVGGEAGDGVQARVEPAGNPVELTVGEMALRRGEDAYCVQLAPRDGPSAFLVGVQSTSEAPGSVPVRVTAEAGVGPDLTAVRPLPPELRPLAGAAVPTRDPAWERHSRAEVRLRMRDREALEALGRGALLPGRDPAPEIRAASVPGDVGRGDTVRIRVPDPEGRFCTDYREIRAEVRAVGQRGVWAWDIGNPPGGALDLFDFAALSRQFDAHTYPTERDYFGRPTDIDSNGRSVFIVTKEVNRAGGLLGFVSVGDLALRRDCPFSDEGELAYLVAPDPGGAHGRVVRRDEFLSFAPRLVAHEFAHVVEFGRRTDANLPFQPVWLTEGRAVLAEEVVGHAVTGRASGSDYGFNVAFGASGEYGTRWYRNRFLDLTRYFGFETRESRVEGAPEGCSWLVRGWGSGAPCVGSRSVYGTPSTLLRWLSDHFGPGHADGEAGLQRALLDYPGAGGFSALEDVVGRPVEELLAPWAAMLYVDGRVPEAGGLLTLPSWDMLDIASGLVETARLQPYERTYAGFQDTVDVAGASSAYLRLSGTSRPATALLVRSLEDSPGLGLPRRTVQLWIVRLR